MRLEDMRPAHVQRAVEIYLENAWPNECPERPRGALEGLAGMRRLEDVFSRFDRPRDAAQVLLARHTLRLGNQRYPFMKFVVQEYLVDKEYFFSVDTHDDLDVRSDNPDYDAWQELKRFNLDLKGRIEAAWARERLPTNRDLCALAEGLARVERETEKRARLLVVDDETEVCRGLGALLEARGYEIELAYDGKQVLERLEREPLPDLILLDYSMPELDGEAVLARLRTHPRAKDVAVLLATASSIDLKHVPRASGFLRKPYPRDVLFAMIAQLLEHRPARREG